MRESAEFAAAYAPAVSRNSEVRPRNFESRVSADFHSAALSPEESEDCAQAEQAAPGTDDGDLGGADSDTLSGQGQFSARVFEAGSPEFADAVAKISPEILRLMRSQFHSDPFRYVRDGIEIEREADKDDAPEEPDSDPSQFDLDDPNAD